ncbi:hypothetical protein C8J57DRAFT_1274171 [Mycena rebaudengoi]|nr:hypothetical protein C8J57DRAFT_1274171 [Mycena rebaudengoi]
MPRRFTPEVAPGERVVETMNIPLPDEGRTMTYIRPIDGDLRHSYDLTLPTEQERRQQLDALETTCTSCAKTVNRTDIKVCARCKGARYCSKECQIFHWKVHKVDCGQPGSPIPRFIERALADPFISFHLSLGIINLLALTQSHRTRMHINTKTSESIVRLTFELDFANIHEFITRFSEIEFPPDVEGEPKEEKMARRTAVLAQHFDRCLSIKELNRAPIAEVPVEVWAQHEEIQQSLPFAAPVTVTLLLIAADGSLGDGKVQAMSIPETAFEHIRLSNNTVSGHSTMFGPQTYNITPEQTREDINNHIRLDRENKLKLRVKPTKRAST